MAELPPLPPGFTLDEPLAELPPLPEGFTLDQPGKPQAATAADRTQAGVAGINNGIAMVLGLPVDTVANVLDLARAGTGFIESQITGRAPESLPDRRDVVGSSEWIRGRMSDAGILTTPNRPDDPASRYLFAGGSAVPAIATARPASAPEAARQASFAAAAGVVPQAAADMGAGKNMQMAAGMATAVVGPAAVGTTRATRAALTPITEGGRRTIAGAALRNASTDPGRSIERIDNAQSARVPGSQPTTGEVTRDPGLAYLQTRLRALEPIEFAKRGSQQNAARQALLDTVADGGLPQNIQARVARRETVTEPMRERAFAQAQGRAANTDQILARIDQLAADPNNAGEAVQQALTIARRQVESAAQRFGGDARALYGVRKDINRIIEGRYVGADESVLRYAGSQLAAVRGMIDDAITEIAPSWNTYLTKYAQLSKPIERAETMQGIRQNTAIAAPDLETGRDVLSQPKWRNVVTNAMPDLERTLTRGQLTKLRAVAAELDRGAAVAAAGKVPGSDTAANLATKGQLSVANIVARTLGTSVKDLPPALGTLTRPLSWVYQLPDEQIKTLIVDAMLDPVLASQLLKEGTRANVQTLADSLVEKARVSGIIVAGDSDLP